MIMSSPMSAMMRWPQPDAVVGEASGVTFGSATVSMVKLGYVTASRGQVRLPPAFNPRSYRASVEEARKEAVRQGAPQCGQGQHRQPQVAVAHGSDAACSRPRVDPRVLHLAGQLPAAHRPLE